MKGFKNLRGQNWKDIFVDFDPFGAYLTDLEVSKPCYIILMVDLLWGCYSLVLR